jgi:holo-[acyl-carrier protein] synthase
VTGFDAEAVGTGRLGVRVGVDIVKSADVAASIDRFGDRYLRRLFTEHELSTCNGDLGTVADRLAARFAAKEATLKVLGLDGSQPEWRSIEVFRTPSGSCEIRLHDGAASLAARTCLGPLAVSLSHEQGVATAVVVALSWDEQPDHG